MKVCTSSTVLILILTLSTCESQDPLATLTEKLEEFMKKEEVEKHELEQKLKQLEETLESHAKELAEAKQDLEELKNVTSKIEGDCHWSSFGPWSECTQPCEGGQQDRTREGHGHGGKDCEWDKAKETRSCNTQSCPVLIQRRGQFGNPQDFFTSKLWVDYEEGFGDETKEYWRGLKHIAALTSTGDWELNVTLVDLQGTRYSAIYDSFKIADNSTYTLRVSGYNENMSNIKDSLTYNNNSGFSTKDRDNDDWETGDCADDLKGAWWYGACGHSSLNGLNLSTGNTPVNRSSGIYWFNYKQNKRLSWPQAEMTIRRKE